MRVRHRRGRHGAARLHLLVVATHGSEGVLPGVAQIGYEAVQDRQRGRLAAARVVRKGADKGRRVREAPFRQQRPISTSGWVPASSRRKSFRTSCSL